MNQNKPFFITTISDEDIFEIISFDNLDALEDTLNQNLILSDYGSKVLGISFIYISQDPDNDFHEESIEFLQKKKKILIAHRLLGSELRQSAPEEVLPLMASAYLAALEKIPTLKLRDFDLLRFKEDVQQVFEKKGWLVAQAA